MKRDCRRYLMVLATLGLCLGALAPAKKAGSTVSSAAAGDLVFAEQVKAEFLHAWQAYRSYAWGYDELQPLSRRGRNWYKESLLLTPVDALDTMLLMGLTAEAAAAKELIFSRLHFDHDMEVQHFEVNIRLLGGLLSAYQLDGDPRFLQLAVELADRMLPVFASPTGMPYRFVNLKTGRTSGRFTNPAEIGTYLLEYGVLSRLTGNPIYYERAKAAVRALYQRRSSRGLVGTLIDVNTGVWVSRASHIGGGVDSYYEYLLKGWRLLGDEELKEMGEESLAAINAHLADESASGLWYGPVNMNSGRRIATVFGALDAFFPALLALAGDLDRAARLQESCWQMWNLYGLEPELLDYRRGKVIYGPYLLRPEIVESAYYLFHYTREEKYREMGREIFRALVEYCRVESGYAAVKDVRTKEKRDEMESYFLAETMKYLYLLFAPPTVLDFEEVTFNTEAHPLFKKW